MLSLESQIIDATTEEGQQVLKKIEEEERQAKVLASSSPEVTETEKQDAQTSAEQVN